MHFWQILVKIGRFSILRSVSRGLKVACKFSFYCRFLKLKNLKKKEKKRQKTLSLKYFYKDRCSVLGGRKNVDFDLLWETKGHFCRICNLFDLFSVTNMYTIKEKRNDCQVLNIQWMPGRKIKFKNEIKPNLLIKY